MQSGNKKKLKTTNNSRKMLAQQKSSKAQLNTDVKVVRKAEKLIHMAVGKREFKRVSVGSESEELAMSMIVPGIVKAVRLPSEYSSEETATANPHTVENASYGQGGGVYAMLQTGSFLKAQYRHPLRATVTYDENSAQSTSQYNFQFNNGQGQPVQAFVLASNLGAKEHIDPMYLTAATLYQPHGPTLYPGEVKDSDGKFIYCADGETVTINTSQAIGDVPLAGIDWGYDYYGPAGLAQDVQLGSQAATGAPQDFVLKDPGVGSGGYYSFWLMTTGSYEPPTINSCITSGTCSQFCHKPLPGFVQNVGSTDAVRIIGSSTLYSNTSSPLNRAGQIAIAQVSSEAKNWLDYVVNNASIIPQISKIPGSDTRPLDNGQFGFFKPVEEKDLEFKSDFELFADTVLITDTYYPIDSPGKMLIQAAYCPVPEGCAAMLTDDYSIEYLTRNSWIGIRSAEYSVEVFKYAMMILKCVEQFHENPTHASAIWNEIKSSAPKILKGFMEYGPGVAKTIATVANTLLPLFL